MDDDAILKSFGEALRRARTRTRGISQDSLGAEAGYDRSYVGRVERGKINLSLAAIVKLAWAAGVPASELFADIDTHAPENVRRQPD